MNALATEAILTCHPCFSERAHAHVGRVHLPVAPTCNIQCAFCERRVCAQLTMPRSAAQHPGWSRVVLTPAEALARVDALAAEHPDEPFVVGVAGPGEPLAHDETLETLAAVHARYPALLTCLSTNGLRLADRLPAIVAAGVRALTVTVNAVEPEIGARLVQWVRYRDVVYRGVEGAALLAERQLAGLAAALEAGLAVKVNTVLVPGINDGHVAEIARRVAALGAPMMNLMALIPGGALRDHRPPTCEELRAARAACEAHLPQFRACQHCRADVVCFPRRAPRSAKGGAPGP